LHFLFTSRKFAATLVLMKNKDKSPCPAEDVLMSISGKWKPQVIRLALQAPVRFSTLLKDITGANKQSISTALKELQQEGILDRVVVKQKPLHVEYLLSEKGIEIARVVTQLEGI
jgi:DNA-binding HxlR family transcriptional regulator